MGRARKKLSWTEFTGGNAPETLPTHSTGKAFAKSKGKGLRESRPSSVEIREWRRGGERRDDSGGEWLGGRCGRSGRGVWRGGGGNGGNTDQRRTYIPPHKRAQKEKEEKAREAREAETEKQKAQDEAE